MSHFFFSTRREQLGKIPLTNLMSKYLPNSAPQAIDKYSCRAYSGQFSDDGTLFYSTCQDFSVRIYETYGTTFRLRKTIKVGFHLITLQKLNFFKIRQFMLNGLSQMQF